MAGATVQWLRDNLNLITQASETEAIAQSVTDTGGCYFVPAFSGLFAPYWRSDARGVIVGLTRYVNRAHIVRAALEAICYQTREVLEAMNADSGVPLRTLKVDGGATTNHFLMQFTADLNNAELRVATMSDCSPLGAVLAGMLGMKVYDSLEALAALPQADVVYQPAMPTQQAWHFYDGWQRAVRQTLCE